ncbi:MAG: helix-turn-helix domain-containing protein [Bacillota bacterium]
MADLAGKIETPTIALTADHARLLQEGGMTVFTTLLEQSATAGHLAERLSIPRARVNFILGRLLADGLVRVEGERSDGERVERTYRACVDSFGLQAGETSSVQERIAAASYITDRLHHGLIRAVALQQQAVCMTMVQARVRRERLKEYMQRLAQLQAEFDSETGAGDDPWYSLTLALYPEAGDPRGEENR